jgi:hypothetical protein
VAVAASARTAVKDQGQLWGLRSCLALRPRSPGIEPSCGLHHRDETVCSGLLYST